MALDLTPYRLEAARNLGIATTFRRRTGRDFTGSRSDYAALTQDEQLRLSAELSRLLAANPPPGEPAAAASPGSLVVASQAAAIQKLAGGGTAQLSDGAVITIDRPGAIGLTAADVGRAAVASATELPATLGRAVQTATGGTVSSLLTKVGVILALGLGAYVLLSTGVLKRARR